MIHLKKWILLIGLIMTCTSYATTTHQTPKVGLMLALTGPQSTLGQEAMNGYLLALQQQENTNNKPEFYSLNNTHSSDEIAQSLAKKLAPLSSVGAGFTDNNGIISAGPFFHQNQVPLLSIGATDPSLTKTIGNNIFLVPFGDNAQAAAAAEFSQQKFGKNVVILWNSTAQYTKSLSTYFSQSVKNLGGNIIMQQSYDGGCDISPIAKKIQSLQQKPDYIYLAGLPSCIGKVIYSLRQSDINSPIVGGDGFDTPNLLEANKQITNVWFTTHAWLSKDNTSAKMQSFLQNYKKIYGSMPSDAFAALGYDAANLLIAALEKADSPQPAAIMTALESTKNFKGLTGDISYSKDSHVPHKTVWIIHVNQGKRYLAAHFIPKEVPKPLA